MAGGPPPPAGAMQPSYAGPGPPVASQPYGTSGHFDPPPLPAAAAMDPGQAFPAGNHGGAAGPLAQPVYGPDLGAPAALNPAAWTDIGPFARPILNKLVRILSALTSLIALILHFAILGQGLTVAMRPNESIENESSNEHQNTDTDAERTTSTTSRRRTSSSRSLTSTRTTRRTILTSTEELLGQRDLPTTSTIETTFAPSSPTFVPARLAIRGILQIRQNNRDQTEKEQNPPTSTNPEIFTYVPNTDVPARDGAIGFTASSHLFAAFVILFLFWWEWLLFMRKPTLFGYWGPLIIAGIQLYMAFDILGRSIPTPSQAGGYVLLLMAVVNSFLAGWTVLHARKKNAPHPLQAFPPPPDQNLNNPYAQNQMMYPAGPDPDAPPLAPVQEGPLPNVDPNAMPYMGEKQSMDQYAQSSTFPPVQPEDVCDGQTYPSVRKDRSHNKRRRASTGTRYNDDVDSYYSRSPTRGRRHSYSGQGSQDYIMPPPAQPVDDVPATSPISLYGPEEYRRRLEQQRRSRRKSLVQPSSMQFDPQTGRYVEPAERFVQRSSQGLPSLEEEEDEEAIRADRLRPDDPRLRQDGFANRTMVWKRLQRNTGIL